MTRFNSRTSIENIDGLIRINPPAIPDVSPILRQSFRRAGHANFIGCLPSTTSRILKLPRKPRMRDIDSQRFLHGFTSKMIRLIAFDRQRNKRERSARQKEEYKRNRQALGIADMRIDRTQSRSG